MSGASVEPWVEPYLADFATIRRILERTPGFCLQPVELPSPDLARALARWLVDEGFSPRTLALTGIDEWRDLAGALERSDGDASAPAVTLVIDGERDIDEAEAHRSLARVNMARDRIARAVEHTILWCGSARLQQWTRQFSPDLWSIAASPVYIRLKQLSDLPASLRISASRWWTGAASEEEHALVQGAAARGGDARARAALRLAEARLVRGDRAGSLELLRSTAPDVWQHSPLLWPRWSYLLDATTAPADAGTDESLVRIRQAIDAARARGDKHGEAALRVELAQTLKNITDSADDVVKELLRARELYLDLGDLLSALEISAWLVLDHPGMLSADTLAAVEAQSKEAADALGDASARALSALIAAQIALLKQELDEAERRADEALEISQSSDAKGLSGGLVLAARLIQTHGALLRGDLPRAQERVTALLKAADEADLPQMQLLGHRLTADILGRRGRWTEAAGHIIEAMTLVGDLDPDGTYFALALNLTQCADRAGATDIADALLALSIPFIVPLAHDHGKQWLASALTQRDPNDPVFALVVRAVTTTDEGVRDAALTELEALAAPLTEALERAGVEPFDPETWPTEPPRPRALGEVGGASGE